MTAQLCFQKPKRLIEEVKKDPFSVIKKVFAETDRDFLREILLKWLNHALTISQPPYETIEQRLRLLFFHDELVALIEVLYFIAEQTESGQEFLKQLRVELNKYSPCNQILPQTKNERLVVKRFYNLFSIEYVRSELWDWLLVAILHNVENPEGIDKEVVTWVYEWVQYLTEAAYQIILKINGDTETTKVAGPSQ